MNAVITGLLGKDVVTILAFADANMRMKPAADSLGVHIETMSRRLDSIYKRSKLNPKCFRDLMLLVKMIEDIDDE